MDLSILKSLIPLLMASIAGLIALVRLQARAAETSKQLDMLAKDTARLENDQSHTVTLVAEMRQVQRNVTELWGKIDLLHQKLEKGDTLIHDKLERHRDRQDKQYQDLRDRVNGNTK